MPPKIRQLKRELRQVGFVVHLRYSMLLEWDPEDEIYVVTVPELPGCLTHGRTLEEAIDQGKDAIESWIDAARTRNIRIPEPRLFAGGRR